MQDNNDMIMIRHRLYYYFLTLWTPLIATHANTASALVIKYPFSTSKPRISSSFFHRGSTPSCCCSRRFFGRMHPTTRTTTTTAWSESTQHQHHGHGKDIHIHDYLPPHYTSQSVLSWLAKMATSYKLERGEDLLDVILRESSSTALIERLHDTYTTYTPLLHLAVACATTNLPIASHDFVRDTNKIAIYNYGNLAFLHGFGYEWEEFVELPSSKCVETPGEVEERQRLLDAVLLHTKSNISNNNNGNDNDDVDNVALKYDNLIRVRKDGRKILLKGVNLWNVYDVTSFEEESLDSFDIIRAKIKQREIETIGQAVWICHVEYLD